MYILIKKVNLENTPDLLVKPDYITQERWNKITKLKTAADKKRSLASGFLQDQMCSRLGIMSPQYGYTQSGKPYIKDHAIVFNLSHSGEYAVLAYQENTDGIGIDIQKIRPMKAGLERRILSEEEMQKYGFLQKTDIDERNLYLNQIWALKESYVKLTGDGLSLDFRNITIDPERGQIKATERKSAEYIMIDEIPEYVLAISVAKLSDINIKYYT